MSVRVNVVGGTNAGTRRPPADPAPDWECACVVLVAATADANDPSTLTDDNHVHKTNPGYLVNCLACGTRRPGTR